MYSEWGIFYNLKQIFEIVCLIVILFLLFDLIRHFCRLHADMLYCSRATKLGEATIVEVSMSETYVLKVSVDTQARRFNDI